MKNINSDNEFTLYFIKPFIKFIIVLFILLFIGIIFVLSCKYLSLYYGIFILFLFLIGLIKFKKYDILEMFIQVILGIVTK